MLPLRLVVAGYGSGIYNSAKYYQQNGIGQSQYRQDLGSALSSSGASASAAASGDPLRRVIVFAALNSFLLKAASVAQQQSARCIKASVNSTRSNDFFLTCIVCTLQLARPVGNFVHRPVNDPLCLSLLRHTVLHQHCCSCRI